MHSRWLVSHSSKRLPGPSSSLSLTLSPVRTHSLSPNKIKMVQIHYILVPESPKTINRIYPHATCGAQKFITVKHTKLHKPLISSLAEWCFISARFAMATCRCNGFPLVNGNPHHWLSCAVVMIPETWITGLFTRARTRYYLIFGRTPFIH